MSDATTTYDIEETLTKFGFGKSDIAKVQNGQVSYLMLIMMQFELKNGQLLRPPHFYCVDVVLIFFFLPCVHRLN